MFADLGGIAPGRLSDTQARDVRTDARHRTPAPSAPTTPTHSERR